MNASLDVSHKKNNNKNLDARVNYEKKNRRHSNAFSLAHVGFLTEALKSKIIKRSSAKYLYGMCFYLCENIFHCRHFFK